MPLREPPIDDRSYRDILNEAIARIPVHNPEWTNYNDSDPGITLLQLFAFMTENLLYRASLIPERNRVKFLRLLGIPMQPARPASGLVTFSNPQGPLQVFTLDPDLELSAGSVPFRTETGLDVLPVESQIFYKASPDLSAAEQDETDQIYQQLYADYGELAYYETRTLSAPVSGASLPVLDLTRGENAMTVDGAAWLALLARKPGEINDARRTIAGKVLTLAMVPASGDASKTLVPGGEQGAESRLSLSYELPRLVKSGETYQVRYQPLQVRPRENVLFQPGTVELLLPEETDFPLWSEADLDPLEQGAGNFPPSPDDETVSGRIITWIRIRVKQESDIGGGQISARLSFAGINGANISQRSRVSNELVGEATGEPDQEYTLVKTPVLKESLRLSVGGVLWARVDDLGSAGPEVDRPGGSGPAALTGQTGSTAASRVFTLDRESGTIRFGNGLQGARPPRGAAIVASYDYGGGMAGNVGINAVARGPMLPAGLKVTNPVPTWGAGPAESVDDAERRITRYLKHRDRLVSEPDIREITLRTPGVEIGRVDVLPLFSPANPDNPAPGVITILVVPQYDARQPDAPEPDRLFLETVCGYLDSRRLITTEMHVRGPEYVPMYVSVGIEVIPGRDTASVRKQVEARLRAFLSPLTGGFDGAGWPLERNVDAGELSAVAARVEGVASVSEVLLGRGAEAATDNVTITDLALPRLRKIAVQPGDPQSLEDLRGTTEEPVEPTTRVPVPIVPPECKC